MSLVVFGSLNGDLDVQVERLPCAGKTVLAIAASRTNGGKGGNQAVAAARAGGALVSFIGAVGDDSEGRRLVASLERNGVRTMVRSVRNVPTGPAIVMKDSEGENAIAVIAGANAEIQPLTRAECRVVAEASVVVCQLENPVSLLADVIEASGSESYILLNAAPTIAFLRDLLAGVSLLVVNEHELATIAVHIGEDTHELMEKMLEYVRAIVVTLGGSGVLYRAQDGRTIQLDAHAVDVIDTTAAGDTCCGALSAALASGIDIAQGLRLANAAAALTVARSGAQESIPRVEDVARFLESRSP